MTALSEIFRLPLFYGIPPEEQSNFLANLEYRVTSYQNGDCIISEEKNSSPLLLLLKGKVREEIMTPMGNRISSEIILAPQTLITPYIFSEENSFPVSLYPLENIETVEITRETIFKLLTTNEIFLRNFLLISSRNVNSLTEKFQLFSYKTIKKKLAFYLLHHMNKDNKYGEYFLNFSLKTMADYFGVTLPALKKVLTQLTQEGIIFVTRRKITIIDAYALSQFLK